MLERADVAPHDEQATVISPGERLLRDTLGGKREVVIARPRPALGEI
jgi:hypothetical protein